MIKNERKNKMQNFFEKIVTAGKIAENISDKIETGIANHIINEDNEKFLMQTSPKSIEQQDQNSAAHDISVINAYGRNKRLNLMVVGAALGLVFCLLMLTTYKNDLPGEVVGIISTVSGIFGACLKDAYSFEFGSSRGSKDKDERISKAILERLKK